MMRLERDGSEPVSGQIARHVTDARIRAMALSIPKTQPMSRVPCNEQQLMAKPRIHFFMVFTRLSAVGQLTSGDLF